MIAIRVLRPVSLLMIQMFLLSNLSFAASEKSCLAPSVRIPQPEVITDLIEQAVPVVKIKLKGTSQEDTESTLLKQLQADEFNAKLENLHGVQNRGQAEKLDPYLTQIGFDGKSNRLGWTINHLAWLLFTREGRQAVAQVVKDGKDITAKYKYVIFCGMGGSGLSVEFVKKTFGERQTRIYSLRTTDPEAIRGILNEISLAEGSLEAALEQTLVIPVSKSGTTQETVSHKNYFTALFNKTGKNPNEHIWVVTDEGSPFDTGEYPQRGIQLNGLGDIGGRFTAPTTNIFLLPLAIVAPERVDSVLKASLEMNEPDSGKSDIFLRLAAFLTQNAAFAGRDKVTLVLPEELKYLAIWMEQLVEESLGKDGKGVTLFYNEKLSPELLRSVEENDRVFLRFNLGREKPDSGLWQYLTDNGYPTFELAVSDLNGVGGLMLGMQRTVAAIAYLWGICFVDQPAVEGYKNATRAIEKQVQETGKPVSVPEQWQYLPFAGLKVYYGPLVEAGILTETEIFTELDKLGERDGAAGYAAILSLLKNKQLDFEAVELMLYGTMNDELQAVMDEARFELFTRKGLASKLGTGPDKNHSFHQNIDAGRNMFLSTYILPGEFEEPEVLGFDSGLIKAQTVGTAISLTQTRRKAVLIQTEGTASASASDLNNFFQQTLRYLAVLEQETGVSDSQAERELDQPVDNKATLKVEESI